VNVGARRERSGEGRLEHVEEPFDPWSPTDRRLGMRHRRDGVDVYEDAGADVVAEPPLDPVVDVHGRPSTVL